MLEKHKQEIDTVTEAIRETRKAIANFPAASWREHLAVLEYALEWRGVRQ